MPDYHIAFHNGVPVCNGRGRLRVYATWDEAQRQHRRIDDVIACVNNHALARIAREYGIALPRMEAD